MARPAEPSPTPDLAETQRQLDERRRRLERIAQRYQQLEEALESLEALMAEHSPRVAPAADEPPEHRPRKPR